MAGLEVIYLDAGQRDCTLILLRDRKTNGLIDCGSIESDQEVVGALSCTNSLMMRKLLINRSDLVVNLNHEGNGFA